MSKEQRKEFRLSEELYSIGKKRLKVASSLQYFLPGVPCIYYGDEVGMQGFEDPINRRPYPWGKEDKELLEHYRYLGKLREEHKADFCGPMTIESNDGKVIIKRGKLKLEVDAKEITFKIDMIE